MELRERYDPEDIESLLSERAFDELLADERAFVLRHVSGREEYEQMRALLHYVRPDEHDRASIDADEAVKRNVMEVFRKQQQPQWRIWLNSVAAWLAPQEASAFWRPALAFGTLALLIVAGVVAVRQFEGAHSSEMAEVRTVPAKPEEAAPTPARTEASAAEEKPVEVPPGAPSSRIVGEVHAAEVEQTKTVQLDVLSGSDLQDDAFLNEDVADNRAEVAREENSEKFLSAEKTPDMQFSSTSDAAAATPQVTYSHVVTADELVRNQSLANEQGVVVAASAGRKRSTVAKDKETLDANGQSRSLAQDPALLSLVAAGW